MLLPQRQVEHREGAGGGSREWGEGREQMTKMKTKPMMTTTTSLLRRGVLYRMLLQEGTGGYRGLQQEARGYVGGGINSLQEGTKETGWRWHRSWILRSPNLWLDPYLRTARAGWR